MSDKDDKKEPNQTQKETPKANTKPNAKDILSINSKNTPEKPVRESNK